MDSQKGKLSTTNPTTLVKGPSDAVKLAVLNEDISALDQFEADSMSRQVEKETLVKIEDPKPIHIPHADQVDAAVEAGVMTAAVMRNARRRRERVA